MPETRGERGNTIFILQTFSWVDIANIYDSSEYLPGLVGAGLQVGTKLIHYVEWTLLLQPFVLLNKLRCHVHF